MQLRETLLRLESLMLSLPLPAPPLADSWWLLSSHLLQGASPACCMPALSSSSPEPPLTEYLVLLCPSMSRVWNTVHLIEPTARSSCCRGGWGFQRCQGRWVGACRAACTPCVISTTSLRDGEGGFDLSPPGASRGRPRVGVPGSFLVLRPCRRGMKVSRGSHAPV